MSPSRIKERAELNRLLKSRLAAKSENKLSENIPTHHKLVYNSTAAIRACRLSSSTFYKYARKLGIKPRKKANCRGRFWMYEDLVKIIMATYQPLDLFDLYFQLHQEMAYEEAMKGEDS